VIDLAHKIKKALQEKVSLSILIDLLYRYSQGGDTQKIAYSILEKIRDDGLEESDEDRILELMVLFSRRTYLK
jgi:hypothetical protein